MKVEIRNVDRTEEEQAVISVVRMTEDLQNAVDLLSGSHRVIPVLKDKENVMCQTDGIYYIESVDKRTYVYTKNGCYETKYRLYELENILNQNFFRAAKAMILNIRKIRSVKAEINGRMSAELLNGERVVIARGFVKDLKERLGI